MVLYIMTWDLPTERANLTFYANKAKNDWIPLTLSHPGVKEFRTYRNALETTPQVAIMVEFESLDSWRSYIESEDYMRIIRELRFAGCRNLNAQLWVPSAMAPLPLRPDQK